MKITFGKFSGWDTEDLARASAVGRDYLAWGAENLRSQSWRDEFLRVLTASTDCDDHLSALAIIQESPDISYDDALNLVREQNELLADENAWNDARESAINAVCTKWALIMNTPADKLRKLGAQFGNDWDERWRDLPASRFSSQDAKTNFLAFMEDYVTTISAVPYHTTLKPA